MQNDHIGVIDNNHQHFTANRININRDNNNNNNNKKDVCVRVCVSGVSFIFLYLNKYIMRIIVYRLRQSIYVEEKCHEETAR